MSKNHNQRKPFPSSEFPSFPSLLPYSLGRQPRSVAKSAASLRRRGSSSSATTTGHCGCDRAEPHGQGAGATASAAIYLLLHMELVGRRHLIIDPAGVRRHRVPATELACLHGRESFALGPVGDAGGRQLCTSSVVAGGRRVADGGRRSAGDNTIFCFLSDLGID
jgi:hypothetical protein